MKDIIIKELKDVKEVLLCKINKTVIAEINPDLISSQTGNINDIDTIEFSVRKKYISPYSKTVKDNIYYDDVIAERFLKIDDEYYVIKEVNEDTIKGIKKVKAYGEEKKLEKINVTLSNMGLALLDSDEENNVYSFNDYLYSLTGWKLNHVDLTVRYMSNGEPKVRIQEDTDTSFYNFITDTIAEQFCCVPIFNRTNKTIDLYDDDAFGDELKIVLSKDNYVKSLIRTTNSNDIVTRLKLKGNEEKCIVENETVNGRDYIEDYSYFIQTKEMSKELIEAIDVFNYLLPERTAQWKDLTKRKGELSTKLYTLNANEDICQAKIKQINALITEYNNMETDTAVYNLDNLKNTLVIQQEESVQLNKDICSLEDELEKINLSIEEINKLCTRDTSTDVNGNLIFTKELLDEFKNFIYYDTYSDDSFTDAKELIKTGKRKLSQQCKPTVEFDIDLANFKKHLLTNKYYKQWNGHIGLGDVISLYDEEKDTEEFVYFVGWERTKSKNSDSIKLSFSNKKFKRDNSKMIADLLKNSKNDKKIIASNKWLWNNQKYNRIDNSSITNLNCDFTFEQPVMIRKNAVTNVTLSTQFINLNIGETYLVVATIEPEDASNKNIIWASSDTTVATVDGGYVKGIKKGLCTIGVITEDGNKTASVTVNVGGYVGEYVKVKNLVGELTKSTLNINESVYYIPQFAPSNATNKGVMYTSSDSTVATVNSEGLITGKTLGDCKIVMSSVDNPEIQCNCFITVTNVVQTTINLSLRNALVIGETRIAQLEQYGLLQDANIEAKEDVSPSYFYKDNDVLSKYTNKDVSCIAIMFGKTNPTTAGVAETKLLLEKIKEKFPSKNIFVIKELPLGINYDSTLSTYTAMNEQIQNYNEDLDVYCKDLNYIYLDCDSKLVTNGLLNVDYSMDGYRLTKIGAKTLINNINKAIYDYEIALDEQNQAQRDSDTSSDNYMYVTVSSLNVREGAGTSYKVLGVLQCNDKVQVVSTEGDWARIIYKDGYGYASLKYLTKDDGSDDDNDDSGSGGSSSSSSGICPVRQKIVNRAEEIYKLCKNGKAWYSNNFRTSDWNHKVKITSGEYAYGAWRPHTNDKGKYGFDCSSLVGCCYQAGGYGFMKGLSCKGGSLLQVAREHNCICWKGADSDALKKAKPGDIVVYTSSSISKKSNSQLKYASIHHTALYIGDGYVVEARDYSHGIQRRKRPFDNTSIFVRIKELTNEDKKYANNSNTPNKVDEDDKTNSSKKDGTNCYNESGVKDGNKYIYKFTKARCTCYGGNASKTPGGKSISGATFACHNMPYGTKIYIPELKGKFGNSTGIWTARDTGGYCFDLDLYLGSTDSSAGDKFSKYYNAPIYTTLYVLSWGTGKCSPSFTDMVEICNKYYVLGSFHTAWKAYMKYGGCTINFHKFNSDDKTIKSKSWYKKL